jgi:hypothetical protein
LAKEIISTLQRRYHGSNLPLASIAKQHGYDFVLTDEKGKKFTSFSFIRREDLNIILKTRLIFHIKKKKYSGKEKSCCVFGSLLKT